MPSRNVREGIVDLVIPNVVIVDHIHDKAITFDFQEDVLPVVKAVIHALVQPLTILSSFVPNVERSDLQWCMDRPPTLCYSARLSVHTSSSTSGKAVHKLRYHSSKGKDQPQWREIAFESLLPAIYALQYPTLTQTRVPLGAIPNQVARAARDGHPVRPHHPTHIHIIKAVLYELLKHSVIAKAPPVLKSVPGQHATTSSFA